MKSYSLPHNSLRSSLRRCWKLLSTRKKWQFTLLLVLMLVGGIAEMATLGAIVPFLTLLAKPSVISTALPIFSLHIEIKTATIVFISLVIIATGIRIALSWATFQFSFSLGADIGRETFRKTIFQPYQFHVSSNTSELIAGINKVNTVVGSVIIPLMQGIVSFILSLAICITLLLIDFYTATIAAIGFSALYLIAMFIVRAKLAKNSSIVADNEQKRIQVIQEGLGGIRDVIIDKLHNFYVNKFVHHDLLQRNAQTVTSIISITPRFVIEALGMVLFVLLALSITNSAAGIAGAISILGALALGAQRLLPHMQQLYFTWSAIKGNHTALLDILKFIERPIPTEFVESPSRNSSFTSPTSFNHADNFYAKTSNSINEPIIAFKNVSFRYGDALHNVLTNINFTLKRESRTGFIGKTGSGKSTLMDLLMGLLMPTEGVIEIEGMPLSVANLCEWQSRIAHVPQMVYIADATIAENIAFGVGLDHIDDALIKKSAQSAQIDDFIEGLSNKYHTTVGERGIRLSGGQRQRIGIARALYKKADVLILDEATSALDDATEKSVMKCINELKKEITILMIAHRLSSLSGCEQIIEIKKGQIYKSELLL